MTTPERRNDQQLRVLIEQLVRAGHSEQEIDRAVRRATDDDGVVLRTRRLSFFR